jgi:CDP-paratose 2-epimerase
VSDNLSLLITGGAGFIGTHAAHRFARRGFRVTVLDNLSRPGAELNLAWLRQECAAIEFTRCDVRDRDGIEAIFRGRRFSAVLHLAAQVAVTTSLAAPWEDFQTNAAGTLHVLEAVRRYCPESVFIFASTNKVYGELAGFESVRHGNRWSFRDRQGVDESTALDFHSPYGCSKGAADQYVIDYARIYGLRSAAFRQSCIYGERQFGVEDQGWVAWFAIAAVLGRPLTIYGDGAQVRDLLHVDDLLDAYELGIEHPEAIAGQAFNLGGGPANTLSLLELIELLESSLERRISPRFESWRPGDQKVFVSDIGKVSRRLGWTPRIGCREGVQRLLAWVRANRELLQRHLDRGSGLSPR